MTILLFFFVSNEIVCKWILICYDYGFSETDLGLSNLHLFVLICAWLWAIETALGLCEPFRFLIWNLSLYAESRFLIGFGFGWNIQYPAGIGNEYGDGDGSGFQVSGMEKGPSIHTRLIIIHIQEWWQPTLEYSCLCLWRKLIVCS